MLGYLTTILHAAALQHLGGPLEQAEHVQLPDFVFSVSAQLSGEAESSRGLVELTKTGDLVSRSRILGQRSKMSTWASE